MYRLVYVLHTDIILINRFDIIANHYYCTLLLSMMYTRSQYTHPGGTHRVRAVY